MSSPTDIRLSFNEVPEIYDRVRPQYPEPMYEALFAELPPAPAVLEVGPGTGQATVALLDHGARVTAVEIGSRLAQLLRSKVESNSRLEVVTGDFESVDLPLQSFDAVISACAYHWISPEARLTRPAALLRNHGLFAIIDLNQVDSPTDKGYFDRVQEVYQRFDGPDTAEPKPRQYPETVVPPIYDQIQASTLFEPPILLRYHWDQTYTAEDYGDLLRSYSGTQMMEPKPREAMAQEMVRIANQEFGGQVTRPLVVTLAMARLAAQ